MPAAIAGRRRAPSAEGGADLLGTSGDPITAETAARQGGFRGLSIPGVIPLHSTVALCDARFMCRTVRRRGIRGMSPTFIGHEAEHRRLRWCLRSPSGLRHRALFARWRDDRWECAISGYSMRPRRWFAWTQDNALCTARLLPWVGSPYWTLLTPRQQLEAPWASVETPIPAFVRNLQLGLDLPPLVVAAAPALTRGGFSQCPLSNTGHLAQFEPRRVGDLLAASFWLKDLAAKGGGRAFGSIFGAETP
jgi:hypothetical protein